jgi:uncharacterized protein YbjT (DUF2867 family)
VKVILFGATGMVGQSVLRECLLGSDIDAVLLVVRSASDVKNDKLREIVHSDFHDFRSIEDALTGYDACFFCLGVSSAGMDEAQYSRVTYDITLAAAQVLARRNPGMTFLYISGAGTDSTERGRIMWARVKGKTENALLKLPFKARYMLRPGYIQPVGGVQSKTRLYRQLYALAAPLYPVLKHLFPNQMITSAELGRAMIHIAKYGDSKRVLEAADIARIARA